jgi:MFS family permease
METETIKTGDVITASLSFPSVKQKGNIALIFAICFISTMFGGIVSMLMSVYLPVTVKDLLGNVTDEKMNDVSAYISAVFLYGWMFGGIVWGVICDKAGRSKSVILSTACYGVFTLLTIVSSSWLLVCVCRFFSGFGIGGVLVTTTILVSEVFADKKRTVMLGIVSVGVPVGFFVAGAINNLLQDWRQAFLVGIVPVLLSLVSIFVLPESDKWKANKYVASQNKNFSKGLFAPAYRKDLLLGSLIFGTMLIGLWAIFSWTPTWVQSISTNTEVQQQRGSAMMILAGAGLTGSFFSGWIANAIGLRKTMLMCFAVCFIMTFIVFKLNASVSLITFIEIGVLAFFFGISQGALQVYIPNLFPVAICASATGFCFNTGRLFTATIVFFIGALVTLLGGYGNSIFVFSFVFIAGFIATLFEKEKQKTNIQ